MKLDCTIEKLKTTLEFVSTTVSKQAVTPLLQNIFIEVKDHIVLFRSTSIDTSSEIRMSAKVTQDGKLLIHGETFTKLIQSIVTQEKNITLEVKETVLVVTYGKNEHTIKLTPFEDFPFIPNISENATSIIIPVEKCIEGITTVSFASAQSDLKPEIASVYVYSVENELVFVSTDSYRLAEKKIRLKQNYPLSILIPNKLISDLVKLLKQFTGDVTLEFNKNTLLVKNEYQTVHIRLIDGVFPNYRQIIPSSSTTTVTTLKHDVQNLIRTLSLFTDRYNQVTLIMVPEEKGCKINTENGDVGASHQFLESVIVGEPLTLSINVKYLSEVLPYLFKESMVFECTTVQRPIVVKSISDGSFTYLIMPLSR